MDFFILLVLAILSFQSFIFSIYLLTLRKGKTSSNRWLACFLILLGAHMVINLVEQRGVVLHLPYLMIISATYGPVLYFYITSLQREKPASIKAVAPHFVPSLLVFLTIHILPKNTLVIVGIGVMVQIFIYLLLAYLSVRHYHTVLRQTQSRFHSISLQWCNNIIAFFTLIIIIDVLNSVFIGTTDIFFLLLILGFLVLVNGLLFKALIEPMIFIGISEDDEGIIKQQRLKYSSSKIDKQRMQQLSIEIKAYFARDKPYLDAEFNLSMLSKSLAQPARDISQTINAIFEANFSDYTNRFRVEAAKEMITSQSDKNISEVLYAVGFNSKSSFYTAFKKITGVSPKTYQAQVLEK